MTAKEMFEKLGYDYEDFESTIRYIKYEKNCFDDEYDPTYFEFDLQDKNIIVIDCLIGLEELQAINKQVEELGWNNEIKRKRN